MLNTVMRTHTTEQLPQMLLVALPEGRKVPECLTLKMICPRSDTDTLTESLSQAYAITKSVSKCSSPICCKVESQKQVSHSD